MLAIVIPYYKLTFFEKTLISLSKQTDKGFNVYIGDDCSPESPKSLISNFKKTLNITYLKFNENKGLVSLVQQWERCIAMTQNEKWIMLLGDDDYLEDNLVESFYNNLSVFNNKSNVIRFSSRVITNKFVSKNQVLVSHPLWEMGYESYCRKIKGQTRSSLSEHIFLKEIFLKKGFTHYPLAFYSDDKAWLDFTDNKPIYSINEACVFIRISNISISGREDNQDLKVEAEQLFFSYLYHSRLRKFNKVCRLHIMRKYELSILKNQRLNNKQWASLYFCYLVNYNQKQFFKFNKRLIKTILYRKKVIH